FPVSEAMSQWKWNLFKGGERSLAYFGIIGEASRGTWGSYKLLRHLKLTHFVSLGALFFSLGLFTSPITQQMIVYPLRTIPVTGEASVPIAHSFAPTNLQMEIEVMKSLVQKSQQPVSPLNAACATGNCTFQNYTSLSICSQVVDLTNELSL
ncbi:hypothetical protein GQ53DRAFT_610158, partial [Thozetella sp. PMI_491]